MSRAAFPLRTITDLRRMALPELDRYIEELRDRVRWLGGPAQKATQKRLAQALKQRAARTG
jgi:hypothetical protein